MTHAQPMDPSGILAPLARRRPRETSLSGLLQHVVDFAGRTMPEVTEASVTVVQGGTAAHTPACTGDLALALDQTQYELGHGPCLQAASTTTVESVSDMATESRWPDWTARALRAGALQVPVHRAAGSPPGQRSAQLFTPATRTPSTTPSPWRGPSPATPAWP